MRVTGGAANLINGVSRQSADVRLTTQLEESVNQWPTITRGLVPRNPAIRLAGLPAFRSGTLKQFIERDSQEQYLMEVGPLGVRVWDLQGNAKEVNAPQGWGYLQDASEEDFQAVTVADHTFILNKNKTVEKAATKSAAMKQNALVHVVSSSYHNTYQIRVNGNLAAQLNLGGGPYDTDEDAREVEIYAKTACIASGLLAAKRPGGGALPSRPGMVTVGAHLVDDPETGAGTLPAATWAVTRLNNVLYIENKSGADFTITANGDNENLLRAHKGTAPDYSKIPPEAPEGFVLKINGDDSSDHDDYFVRFTKDAGAAEGRWKETHAPDAQHWLNPGTMPHILVREADGTFTFKPAEWEERKVGDEETSPWPSFVDRRISCLVYGQGRLGLCSGESIALSRHNKPFSFFRESLLTALDTDPVDLSINYPEVSTINHAVPMGDEIVLFTSSVQFRLSADGQRLTSDNGSIKPLLSTKASSRATPVSGGSRVYFANDASSGSFLHEFMYDREGGVKNEEDITAHVQGYLPGRVDLLCMDATLRHLFLVGKSDPQRLLLYRWMMAGTERVQAAWQEWRIPQITGILAMRIMSESLILAVSTQGGAELLSINLHEAWKPNGRSAIYLDRQISLTGTYDPGTHRTTFELPYSGPADAIRTTHGLYGVDENEEWTPAIWRDATDWTGAAAWSDDGSSFYLEGDREGEPLTIGIPFESYGVLSPLLYRPSNNTGGYGNAVAGVDTWVSSLAFGSGNTAFLEVVVNRRYRTPYRQVLTPSKMGTDTGSAGGLKVGRATGTISVMCASEDLTVRFGSSTPHPYEITGLTWSGNATPSSL